MRALSIIGIILSVFGMILSLFIMTEARCHCYCSDSYLYSSSSVPDEAIGGSLIMMAFFIFFLIYSIVSLSKNIRNRNAEFQQSYPQPISYPPYGQHFQQQFQQQYPPNTYPSTNPYQQPNPYPQQNPFPPQNPYDQPNFQNPVQNPTNNPNPWAPPPNQTPPTE